MMLVPMTIVMILKDVFILKLNVTITMHVQLIDAILPPDASTLLNAAMITMLALMILAIRTKDVNTRKLFVTITMNVQLTLANLHADAYLNMM
jgi:hypothetical protein